MRLAFPRTAQGFGRRFNAARRMIELQLRCRISECEAGGGRRLITITPQANSVNSAHDNEEVAHHDPA